MTELSIVGDEVVVKWTGRKGRGSLFQIMATGNAKNANILSAKELLAVFLSVKICPFPLGAGETIYRKTLAAIDTDFATLLQKTEAIPVGQLRKEIVVKAGEGCNAPTDMYLDIAAKIKRGE